MVFTLEACVTAHSMFDCFICRKVHGVCGTYHFRQMKPSIAIMMRALPAPTTTLETPLHSVRKPSTLDIVIIALDMPV